MKNKKWWGVRLAGLCALASLLGPLSLGSAHGAYSDCTLCHLDPAPGSRAKDYFDYFATPQHPTGITYPSVQNQGFFRPTGLFGDIVFFDRNGNGVPDLDEVQLFGGASTVECASCHREHGETGSTTRSGTRSTRVAMYLRLGSDMLCMVCHRI